jgi:hypothetical protein
MQIVQNSFLKLNSELILCSELNQRSESGIVEACRTFEGCRNQLIHPQADSVSLNIVSDSFEAGRVLLAFFPPNEALAALALLKSQFNRHKQFKNERMAALGWQFGPSSRNPHSEPALLDPRASLAEGQAATAVLTEILDDDQSRHSVTALGCLSSAVQGCNRLIAVRCNRREYVEAQKLKVTAFSCAQFLPLI